MPSQKDCVFVTVPFTDTNKPLMAPAILKSVAMKAGRSATVLDLNIRFLKHIETLDMQKRMQLLGFFREESWSYEILPEILHLIQEWAQDIAEFRPSLVGISVFTYNCRCCAKYLSWALKKIDPKIKIIMGGAGILHHFAGAPTFAENLRNRGVIDDYVVGDSEKPLYSYLKYGPGDYPGLNGKSWIQLSNSELEQSPMPDYDDYDFDQYAHPSALPINGSRGCVRHCDFCDVHAHWKKFSFRGGSHVFDEMLTMKQRYGVNNFHFTDSLINGNLKEYRILMRLIADHNEGLPPEQKLRWSSFFIFRSASTFGEDDWILTSRGGAYLLSVGIETMSDRVRKHLGKNFTNKDIEFSFQMIQKLGNMKVTLLFLTGHPLETDQDHAYELEWWPQQVRYKDIIAGVNTGTPVGILHNTPLENNFHQLGLIKIGPAPEDWINPVTGSTPAKRVKWNDEIVEVVKRSGFAITVGHDAHYILERMRHQNVVLE